MSGQVGNPNVYMTIRNINGKSYFYVVQMLSACAQTELVIILMHNLLFISILD